METIFINSEHIKKSDPHRLLLKLTDKINLKRSDKYVALSNLSIYYTWKNINSHRKTINVKYQLQHGMRNLNHPIDHILYQILKTILSTSSKNMRQLLTILQ